MLFDTCEVSVNGSTARVSLSAVFIWSNMLASSLLIGVDVVCFILIYDLYLVFYEADDV